jgi:phosphatidylinositol alpha-mannosyltransferase
VPSKYLKIGFIVDDTLDKPDGVQQYVLALGDWLSRQGHDVHYLAGESRRTDLKGLHSLSKNVHVKFNGNHLSIPLPASRDGIRLLLEQESFDVLHVQTPHSPFLAQRIIMAAPDSTAMVSTFHILPHTQLAAQASRLLRWWLRPSLQRIDAFLAVSDAAQEFAQASLNIDCTVVPNAINLQPFTRGIPFPEYAKTLTITYLNRLEPRKGCMHLLRAVDYLKHESGFALPFQVVICGKGSEAGALKKFARDHELDDSVSFKGFVDEVDKPRYLASSDVVVYPSTSGESFGIVLLEGMAASRGVVLAGNNPGYASVMGRFPEQLFDPKNVNTFATLLARALSDDEIRAKAVIKQKEYAKTFDIEVIGPNVLSIYKQILHAKRGVQ